MKCIDKKCEYRGLNGGDEISDFYFCAECGVSVNRGEDECLFDKWEKEYSEEMQLVNNDGRKEICNFRDV